MPLLTPVTSTVLPVIYRGLLRPHGEAGRDVRGRLPDDNTDPAQRQACPLTLLHCLDSLRGMLRKKQRCSYLCIRSTKRVGACQSDPRAPSPATRIYRAWATGTRSIRSCVLSLYAFWGACAAVGRQLLPAHVWRCQKAARSSFCAGIGKQWGDMRRCWFGMPLLGFDPGTGLLFLPSLAFSRWSFRHDQK